MNYLSWGCMLPSTFMLLRLLFTTYGNSITISSAERLEPFELSEDDVPDEYNCCISWEVMTFPVYDPKFPQYKFEKANIEKHLHMNGNIHPFTRTLLSAENLIEDENLKNRIDDFISSYENEKNSPSP